MVREPQRNPWRCAATYTPAPLLALRASVFLTLALLLFATPASAQTLLRWKFAKDQKYQVACTQQTQVETSISGKAQKAYLDMTMELGWEVNDVDASGVATLTQSFSRLAVKTTAPGADAINYDTASATKPSGAAKEIAASVAPLIGAKFIVKMNARGEVLGVELLPETEKALAALPADSQLKQVLSPDGLTQLFRLGGALPEKEVNAGDTWPVTSETKTPYGTLTQETKFTFVGVESKEGKSLGKLTFAATGKLSQPADATLQLDIKEQTKTGTILLDVDAGYVTSGETKLLSKSTRPFRNQVIQVTIEGTTKLAIERE